MYKKYSILLLALILISCSNSNQKESLDEVKAFKPDDKYFKSTLVSLHFITETSEIAEVDSTFNQIVKRYKLPVDAAGCKDGEFIGESPYDAFDYKHVVKLKIENEKITEVDYNEIKKSGIGKQEDMEYCEEMSVDGTTPAIAYPDYEKQLLQKQSIENIDAVSGATYSEYRFKYAVMVALMKARLQESI